MNTYEQHMRIHTLVEFMSLLAEPTFAGVDYGIVRDKVSPLAEVTPSQLEAAIELFRRKFPGKTPNINNMMSYVGSVSASASRLVKIGETNAMSRSARSLWRTAAAAAASSSLTGRGTIYDFR